MDSDETTLPARPKPRSAPKTAAPKPSAKRAAERPAVATGQDGAVRKPRVPAPPKKPTLALVAEPGETGPDAPPLAKPPMLKKKDLVDQVVQAVGGKKKGVKEIVDATLAALGEALSRGDGLNLPPLGRAHVNRQRDLDGGEMMIVKLRRDVEGAAPKQKARRNDDSE